MGEYAKYNGSEIKIGTCESMYYLRADQRHAVTAIDGSVDPVRDREALRFRFPFPAEDSIEPGMFDYPLPEITVRYPSELPADHGTVSVDNGKTCGRRISAAMPCPMVAPEIWHQYVRGYTPKVRIAYQGYRGGNLAVIVECAYCDGMWNLAEWADAEVFVISIRSEADEMRQVGEHQAEITLMNHGPHVHDGSAERYVKQAAELHTIADRITAGYFDLAMAPRVHS